MVYINYFHLLSVLTFLKPMTQSYVVALLSLSQTLLLCRMLNLVYRLLLTCHPTIHPCFSNAYFHSGGTGSRGHIFLQVNTKCIDTYTQVYFHLGDIVLWAQVISEHS